MHKPFSSKRVAASIRWQLFFLFLLFKIQPAVSQRVYDYNADIQNVYQAILDLELPAASAGLQRLAEQQPENLARIHLENYYDFFLVYASDEVDQYKILKKNRSDRLNLLEEGPADSPWHLYTQADVRLQWAFLKFQFGDYFSGFLEVKKAFQLLEENVQRYPGFAPNYKDLGILHALIGTVPEQYQWGVRLLSGLEGSIEQGQKELQKCLENKDPATQFLMTESRLLYSYLLVYIGWDQQEAWRLLQPLKKSADEHIFQAFIYSNVAFRSGHNDEAIRVLEAAQRQPGWKHFPILEFQLGNALLRKLESKGKVHFQKFLNSYQGRQDVKATYHRLAWYALLKKDTQEYLLQMKTVQSIGEASSGRDKDALKAAELGFVPQIALLKARLLFDGGYYLRALQELRDLEPDDFVEPYEKLELNYRRGRIYHGQGNWSKALYYYDQVYKNGVGEGFYFSCNAALQMGLIFEEQGNAKEARLCFQKCLDAKAEVYQNSLHMAAKAGLQRIKN